MELIECCGNFRDFFFLFSAVVYGRVPQPEILKKSSAFISELNSTMRGVTGKEGDNQSRVTEGCQNA